MIQRIQTIHLLLSVVVGIIAQILNFNASPESVTVVAFAGVESVRYIYIALIGIGVLLALWSIFLYKNRMFQLKEREGGLRQHIEHLVLDFRYYCLGAKQKELLAQLKTCKDDYVAIMTEYKRVKEIYDELAKKLGR